MKRICAWCKKDLDTGEQLTEEQYKIASQDASHGMCPECDKKVTGEELENEEITEK